MARPAALTSHSQRLTPVEVAQLWFRRGAAWAGNIHVDYPDFPKPGPDGLYLREQVKGWFDRWHGLRALSGHGDRPEAEREALEIARGGRR